MRFKKYLILVALVPSLAFGGSFGDAFGRALGEVAIRLLLDTTFHSLNTAIGHKKSHRDTMNSSSFSNSKRNRPRLLSEEGKKVDFLFEVKFVHEPTEVMGCVKQKTVYHRSYFPWFVDYPAKGYMDLWYNNQTIKELAMKNLSNVVLIKGQEKNPIRVKQEADLYNCPKLKPIALNSCKWIKSERIKLATRNHHQNRDATIKMMNKAAELKGNNIGFITRVGKSALGMQKFTYEVFNCKN